MTVPPTVVITTTVGTPTTTTPTPTVVITPPPPPPVTVTVSPTPTQSAPTYYPGAACSTQGTTATAPNGSELVCVQSSYGLAWVFNEY